MKIKKYFAPTMPEAMQQIRKELGSDAVILNSREVKKGKFLGLVQKKYIEVIAALDPYPIEHQERHTPSKLPEEPVPYQKHGHQDHLLTEIKDLKNVIYNTRYQDRDFPAFYQVMHQYLQDQDIEQTLSRSIIEVVMQQHPDVADEAQAIGYTRQELEKRLKQLPFEGITFNKQIIHFVGPTGVGKTTTLAKAAAKAMITHGKKVAFITVDTYRIAAIEQLKTYARILNVPVEVAYDINEYRSAVKLFHDYDLIFVDTAGRNFQSEKYIQELKRSIEFNDAAETYLVLSLTAKAKDMIHIHQQFKHLPLNGLIGTKVDETRQFGGILNIGLQHKLDISCMTNGQDVPDDIIEPTPAYISKLVMEEFGHG